MNIGNWQVPAIFSDDVFQNRDYPGIFHMFNLIAGYLCKYLYLYVHILVIGLLSNDTCTLLLMNYVSTKDWLGLWNILTVELCMYLSYGIWNLSNRNCILLFKRNIYPKEGRSCRGLEWTLHLTWRSLGTFILQKWQFYYIHAWETIWSEH